jgi:hypothetical protein
MRTLKSLEFKVDRGDNSHLRTWLYGESKQGYLFNFLFIDDEFKNTLANGGIVRDGYHTLATMGERWTFFNMPCPRDSEGTFEATYIYITVPYRLADELNKRLAAALLDYDNSPRVNHRGEIVSDPARYGYKKTQVVDLSAELEALTARYGQGTGKSVLIAGDETRAQLVVSACPGLQACLDRLEQIAVNSTYEASDRTEIRLYRDGDSFGFYVTGLRGGVINHGTPDLPEWSIHT